VNEFASSAEIKKGYMALSLRHHPDKLAGATEAQLAEAKLLFHDVCEAHSVLSDMATRREYDRARCSAYTTHIQSPVPKMYICAYTYMFISIISRSTFLDMATRREYDRAQ